MYNLNAKSAGSDNLGRSYLEIIGIAGKDPSRSGLGTGK